MFIALKEEEELVSKRLNHGQKKKHTQGGYLNENTQERVKEKADLGQGAAIMHKSARGKMERGRRSGARVMKERSERRATVRGRGGWGGNDVKCRAKAMRAMPRHCAPQSKSYPIS